LRDVSERSAFLIGRDGVVLARWSYDTTEVPDFDGLLRAAREALQPSDGSA
jgi:peroxiredoxin